MSAPDDRRPDDELTRRYREANAQDMRRPGAHVRQAVQAHAQAVLAARADGEPVTRPQSPKKAANQPRWKLSMLASIALAALTGLLVLQFERGTPEEKDLAMGQPRASAPAAQNSAPPAVRKAAPPPQPSAKPAPALKAPAPAPVTQPQPESRTAAVPGPESKAAPSQGSREQEAATAPSAFPASPPAAAMAPPPAMTDRASRAPMPAPAAAAPAPASEARLQSASPQSGVAATPPARGEASGFADNNAALLDAARSGRSADIVQLLRRGVPINTTDGLGRTPLILAVINRHEPAVQQLLALGANRALADQQGLTALDHARKLGLSGIAAMIEAAR